MSPVVSSFERYAKQLCANDDPVLKEMEAQAHALEIRPLGPVVGQLLLVLATAVNARRVLEIGSGLGYSAYWFCKAVGPEGDVVLTETDPALAEHARRFLTLGGFADRITVHPVDADQTLLEVAGEFDIIFLNCQKADYPSFLDLTLSRLRTGGLLIANDVLAQHRVLHEDTSGDRDAQALKVFNQKLFREPRLASMIMPLHDGISVSVKVA